MNFKPRLTVLRKDIDKIDSQIRLLLKKRFACVKKISKLKKSQKLPTKDLKREEFILKKAPNKHQKMIFRTILSESRKAQYSFDKKRKN